MEYVDHETRGPCEARGWAQRVRTRWNLREKPVARRTLADLEWKLIPTTPGKPTDAASSAIDGTYYVLSVDLERNRCRLQHDTVHVSIWGPAWEARPSRRSTSLTPRGVRWTVLRARAGCASTSSASPVDSGRAPSR